MRIIRPLLPITFLALMLAGCSGSSAQLAPVGQAPDTASQPEGAPPVAGGKPVDGSGLEVGARDDAKIIRTGTMDLEVTDVPTAVRAARDAIVALGGYVGASNTSNQGDQPTAQITYRIPADKWEDGPGFAAQSQRSDDKGRDREHGRRGGHGPGRRSGSTHPKSAGQ